jgi:hypothetical protein
LYLLPDGSAAQHPYAVLAEASTGVDFCTARRWTSARRG